MHFGHNPVHTNLALAGLGRSERQGLKQVLAVDVLTGKSKHLTQDNALRMPPKIEDTRLAEYVFLNAADIPSASRLLQSVSMIPGLKSNVCLWVLMCHMRIMLQSGCH